MPKVLSISAAVRKRTGLRDSMCHMKTLRFLPVFSFLLVLLPVPAFPSEWYDHAVIYEIYPRSFQDSNGDGIGDINGITSRLDYLKDLGIDAIWITPIYPSPAVDYGYDISDYTAIDPKYGNMADFDRLVAEAKKRNICVFMDYVINHTSDKHPWHSAWTFDPKTNQYYYHYFYPQQPG